MDEGINKQITDARLKNLWKLLAVIGAFASLLILGVIIYNHLTATRITVESEQGAVISISEGKGQPFEQIGTSKASYSSGGDISVFVRADKDGKATQRSVLVEDGQKNSVYLGLEETAESSVITNASLSNLFINDSFVFGINPSTRSISASGVSDSSGREPSYYTMPFVDKITWRDADNFIFNSLRYGVGVFANGSLTERLSFSDNGTVFGSFAYHQGRPLVLMAGDGIYSSDDFGESTDRLVDITPVGIVLISSDNDSFYYVNTISPEVYEGTDRPFETTVRVYDYSGNKIDEFKVDGDIGNPIKVINLQAQNKIVLLTNKGVVFIDKATESVDETRYHASSMEDMLFTDSNELLFLGSDGLWALNDENGQYNLVNGLSKSEEYVQGSLSQINGKVYYSVQPTRESLRDPNSSVAGAVYEISL